MFPVWKKREEPVKSQGVYVHLTECVHLFTWVVFIPIQRPEQLVMNTLK